MIPILALMFLYVVANLGVLSVASLAKARKPTPAENARRYSNERGTW